MPFKSLLYYTSKERGDPSVLAYYSMHPNEKIKIQCVSVNSRCSITSSGKKEVTRVGPCVTVLVIVI